MTKKIDTEDQTEAETAADMEPENIEGETRNEAFRRLANKRLPVAVKRIRMIGNLSGANYQYTPEQAEVVIDVLQREVDKLREAFFKVAVEDDIPTL